MPKKHQFPYPAFSPQAVILAGLYPNVGQVKTIVMRDGDNAAHRVETPQGLPGKLNRRSVTCLSVHKNEVIAFYKKVRRLAVVQKRKTKFFWSM